MKYLSIQAILFLHYRLVTEFDGETLGGDNPGLDKRVLINPESLEFVLAEIRGLVYPYHQYSTLVEKAAVVGWRIITRHVFFDGNKRAGLASSFLMLNVNGYLIRSREGEAEEIAVGIAKGEVTLEKYVEWLRERMIPVREERCP